VAQQLDFYGDPDKDLEPGFLAPDQHLDPEIIFIVLSPVQLISLSTYLLSKKLLKNC